jgi:hypothetical protein
MPSCLKNKIVVFDLDETLGYFSEFGMIWESVLSYVLKNKNKNKKEDQQKEQKEQLLFNSILDLYPEFLRPNIFSILEYVKKQKIKSKCNKLILYTNNQGPTEWAKSIIKYFEMKLNYKLFDQIIAAYKINGKQVEMCRTTYSKTHDDLLKCSKLPANTEICFLDDIYHPGMENDNIYYINVKPYKHDVSFFEIIKRLIRSKIVNIINENEFKEEISQKLIQYHYTPRYKSNKDQELDIIISKKIKFHLKYFFGDVSKKEDRNKKEDGNKKKVKFNKKYTKKYNKNIKNKTIKIK